MYFEPMQPLNEYKISVDTDNILFKQRTCISNTARPV